MFSTTLLIAVIIVILASYFLTHAVIRISSKTGMLSHPNHRSSHSSIMPHGGGVGFVVPFVILVAMLFYFEYMPKHYWLVLVGCGSLIVAMGLWDDIADISAVFRLIVQFVCVGIGVWVLSGAYEPQAGNMVVDLGLTGYCLAVFILIWWLNLFNFMDGIDGLAGTEAVYIALSAILMLWLKEWVSPDEVLQESKSIGLLLLFLSASVFGFLVHNWAPARVFMGDVGSTFLGFAIGMVALSSILLNALSVSVWLILGAVFWVDATFTLTRRMIAGERWYLAHKSHAYQQAVAFVNDLDKDYGGKIMNRLHCAGEGHAHKSVCLWILAIDLFWLLPLAGIAVVLPESGFLVVLLAWVPLVWIAFRLNAGKENAV